MNLYTEIEKTFSEIENAFSQEDLLDFVNTPLVDLHLYHFSLGTLIRNNYLWHEKNVLHELFLGNGINHPDDMSYFIIRLFHYYIQENIKTPIERTILFFQLVKLFIKVSRIFLICDWVYDHDACKKCANLIPLYGKSRLRGGNYFKHIILIT